VLPIVSGVSDPAALNVDDMLLNGRQGRSHDVAAEQAFRRGRGLGRYWFTQKRSSRSHHDFQQCHRPTAGGLRVTAVRSGWNPGGPVWQAGAVPVKPETETTLGQTSLIKSRASRLSGEFTGHPQAGSGQRPSDQAEVVIPW